MYCVNGENKARDGQKWASNNWAHARFAKSPVIKPREEIRSAEGHYRISGICVLLTDTSSAETADNSTEKASSLVSVFWALTKVRFVCLSRMLSRLSRGGFWQF